MFDVDVDKLCTTRSPYYLQKWVDTFKDIQQQAFTDFSPTPDHLSQSAESVATVSTSDLDNYCVDEKDGVDMECSMVDDNMIRLDVNWYEQQYEDMRKIRAPALVQRR